MKTYIKVKLTVPTNFDEIFNILDNESIGVVIREALRSAIRPMSTHLKALVINKMREKSKQSTGALARAISTKTGRSKINKLVFYALVGINTSAIEVHDLSDRTGRKRKGKHRGLGLVAERFTQVGKKKTIAGLRTAKGMPVTTRKFRSKKVFSTYKKNRFMRMNKGSLVKRKPSRYFHLINYGFNHRWGVRSVAYEFLEEAYNATINIVETLFLKRITELVVPQLQRQIDRNKDRVTKQTLRGR